MVEANIFLKAREIEILRLMREGLTNREIADRIYISVETVRWYAKQIYSKLDVSGRDEAAEKAHELGLLDAIIDPDEDTPEPHYNLPRQLTPFLGREAVIASILEMLSDTRLLTLTGVGGTGKTRLCLRVGEEVVKQFRDGVIFVDLASVQESERVPHAIADALDVYVSGNAPVLDILKSALAEKRLLLILDNYEHLLDAAYVATELLTATQHLKILATSREALRLSGEQVYAVPPMTLPGDHGNSNELLDQSEAVALFVQRAQSISRNFQLTEENAADVVTICQRLDGLPLAIELAATSSRMLSPAAIVQRLDDRFRVLRSGSRDAPQRHQTLRATIDWSYNQLTDDQKRLFARLSVFRGGRSLEAIEAICSHDLSLDVLDGIASLVDKSLVRLEEGLAGEPRFVLLETLQDYAFERLEESGEIENMRRRHAAYFVEFVEHIQSLYLENGAVQGFQRLSVELANLRAIIRWSLPTQEFIWGIRLLCCLDGFWATMGQHVEGQQWMDQAMGNFADIPPQLRAQLLRSASWLAYLRQEPQKISDYAPQVMALSQEFELNDILGNILSLQAISMIGASEDEEQPKNYAKEAVKLLRGHRFRTYVYYSLHSLVMSHNVEGEYERAKQFGAEAMPIAQSLDSPFFRAIHAGQMGLAAMGSGQLEEAYVLFKSAIQNHIESSAQDYYVASNVKRMAGVYGLSGHFVHATKLLSAAQSYVDAIFARWVPDEQLEINQTLAFLHENMEDTDFQAAWEEGRKMSLDEAVAYAFVDSNF